MKNQDFLKQFSEIVQKLNNGEYRYEVITGLIKPTTIDSLTIIFHEAKNKGHHRIRLKKPVIQVSAATNVVEFTVTALPEIERYWILTEKRLIRKLPNGKEFTFTSTKGDSTTIGIY